MKALVKAKREPGIWMQDVPAPEVGPNDVLIRVRRASICGTDIHILNWDEWSQRTVPVPLTIGHEFMGEIAGLGSAVSGFQLGERVSAEGHITCGHCRNCRAGKRHLPTRWRLSSTRWATPSTPRWPSTWWAKTC
jgi:threonine 3-dehydrogenase